MKAARASELRHRLRHFAAIHTHRKPLSELQLRQEVAKAREMDALKRNAFNVRNDLENVFRTTLHDLNVTYQDQAFDAMVEEAKT